VGSPDPARIARVVERRLGRSVMVTTADQPLPRSALAPAECAEFDRLPKGPRQRSWLTGRRALRRLLRALGYDPETGAVAFPHPRLSLTHSANVALAVGVRSAGTAGVGIDFEQPGRLRFAGARFYLGGTEQGFVRALPACDQPRHLLRLWTVKEAVFKANPANAATRLDDYRLAHPADLAGTASGPPGCPPIHYATAPYADAPVTVAIAPGNDQC
jgi:phosphopantetheinyl transferase